MTYPCHDCAAAPICTTANSRYALQCTAFRGPTVRPATGMTDEHEQQFQAWIKDNHPAMPDIDDRREAYYEAGMYPPKPVR